MGRAGSRNSRGRRGSTAEPNTRSPDRRPSTLTVRRAGTARRRRSHRTRESSAALRGKSLSVFPFRSISSRSSSIPSSHGSLRAHRGPYGRSCESPRNSPNELIGAARSPAIQQRCAADATTNARRSAPGCGQTLPGFSCLASESAPGAARRSERRWPLLGLAASGAAVFDNGVWMNGAAINLWTVERSHHVRSRACKMFDDRCWSDVV